MLPFAVIFALAMVINTAAWFGLLTVAVWVINGLGSFAVAENANVAVVLGVALILAFVRPLYRVVYEVRV